jgi:hypothetical protein
MKKKYQNSARTQDPQFLGAANPAIENQPRPAIFIPGDSSRIRHPLTWTCLICGETLRLIRVYRSGRGFEMRCEGTDPTAPMPHKLTLYFRGRKGAASRLLSGVPCESTDFKRDKIQLFVEFHANESA